MDRLPKRFEKEELALADIFWFDKHNNLPEGYKRGIMYVSPYEISARGLEAFGEESFELMTSDIGFSLAYCEETDQREFEAVVEDQDFCECVFKAIEEVYKDESEGE